MQEVIADLCAVAEQLAIQNSDELPIDPKALAEKIGIEVRQHEGRSRYDHNTDPPIIWVPADMEPERQRFRIAHELCEGLMREHDLERLLPEGIDFATARLVSQTGRDLVHLEAAEDHVVVRFVDTPVGAAVYEVVIRFGPPDAGPFSVRAH